MQNIPFEIEGSWTVRFGGEARSVTVEAPSGCGEEPPPPEPAVSIYDDRTSCSRVTRPLPC